MSGVGATYGGWSRENDGPDEGIEGAAEYAGGTSCVACECHGVSTWLLDEDAGVGADDAGGATEAAGLWCLLDWDGPGRAPALDGLPKGEGWAES